MSSAKRPFDWQWTLTTVLAVGMLGAMMWMIHEESARLAAQAGSAERRMARIETALHILAGTHGEKTRRKVDAALTMAKNPADSGMDMLASVNEYVARGEVARARSSAENARTLFLTAQDLKTPAPPGFFADALSRLDGLAAVSDPDLAGSLFAVRVALAEYRSGLEPLPKLPDNRATLALRPGQPIDPGMLRGSAVYSPTAQATLPERTRLEARGAVIDGSQLPQGTEFLRPAGLSFTTGGSTVSGLTFEGVTQTLDGMEWNDVVFANARVRYHGGPLRLVHVVFVNCTFEVSQNDRGKAFANAVALGRQTLKIG